MYSSSRRTRSSYSQGVQSLVDEYSPGLTFWVSTEILLIIDKLQKLDSGRLQTLWEWKNRVLLEEYYTFNEAIPPEERFEQKTCSHVKSSHGRIVVR